MSLHSLIFLGHDGMRLDICVDEAEIFGLLQTFQPKGIWAVVVDTSVLFDVLLGRASEEQ